MTFHPEIGTFPPNAVGADRAGRSPEPSGMIVKFVKMVGGIVPDSVVERRGERLVSIADFEFRFGFQNGIPVKRNQRMEDPDTVCGFNQPVIHKKLTARTENQRFAGLFQPRNGKRGTLFIKKTFPDIRNHALFLLVILFCSAYII